VKYKLTVLLGDFGNEENQVLFERWNVSIIPLVGDIVSNGKCSDLLITHREFEFTEDDESACDVCLYCKPLKANPKVD